jgi:hypothetical protein
VCVFPWLYYFQAAKEVAKKEAARQRVKDKQAEKIRLEKDKEDKEKQKKEDQVKKQKAADFEEKRVSDSAASGGIKLMQLFASAFADVASLSSH